MMPPEKCASGRTKGNFKYITDLNGQSDQRHMRRDPNRGNSDIEKVGGTGTKGTCEGGTFFVGILVMGEISGGQVGHRRAERGADAGGQEKKISRGEVIGSLLKGRVGTIQFFRTSKRG